MKTVKLYGRVILTAEIHVLSGLHIGGSTTNLEIGAVDMPVIRNAKSGEPYIPGSSLKGKMRSLAEKLTGAPQNKHIGKGVNIHVAETEDEYKKFWVNPVFGVPGEVKFAITGPTRLVVRDVALDPVSLEEARANLDLPYTEVKWENALDRVTAAATPRQVERVPAGAIFKPMQLVFSLYQEEDCDHLANVFTALQLVEDDYLGGHGSRGSGKVAFNQITLSPRIGAEYRQGDDNDLGDLAGLSDTDKEGLADWARGQFFANGIN